MPFFTLIVMAVTLGLASPAALPRVLPVAAVTTGALPDSCAALMQPKHLPSLGIVLDSTALMTRLQALDTTSTGNVIVGVRFSSGPTGHIVERSASAPLSELVMGHVLASLRPASKGAPPAFRVHVRLGPAPTIALERSVLCRPLTVEHGGGEIRIAYGRVESAEAAAGVMPSRPRPITITPSLRISATGQVEEVNLGAGTGEHEVDRSIREKLLAWRFHPALLDGRPVAVWVSSKQVGLIP